MANFAINTAYTHGGNQDVTYDVTEAGYVYFEMWGAGGGGAHRNLSSGTGVAAMGRGGGGGYVEGRLKVVPGDQLRLRVGNGGGGGVLANGGGGGGSVPGPGGGGGGNGSRQSPSTLAAGGGGGCTLIYLNGVIAAVAGGGGGAGVSLTWIDNTNSVNPQPLPNFSNFGGGTGGGLNGGQGWTANLQNGGGGGGQNGPGGGRGNGEGALTGGHGYATTVANGATNNTAAGGGGGAGWYGGGGGGAINNSGGGGGSSYLHPTLVLDGLTKDAVAGLPAFLSRRIADAGRGGTSNLYSQTFTADVGAAGVGGGAFLAFTPLIDSANIPDAPATLTDVGYTGRRVTYRAPADGVIRVELWGGGGGGASRGGGPDAFPGGGGGAVAGEFKVLKGDLISYEVAQGGRSGIYYFGGGAGGWPDGGQGGKGPFIPGANKAGGNLNSMGGGGGSTRVYLNGYLITVAAGGGGSSGSALGGGGGGTTGNAGVVNPTTPSIGVSPGSGGTQGGGFARLFGGGTGNWNEGAPGSGAGGGGGWFGGNAGVGNGPSAPPGGGGSSYIADLLNAETAIGVNAGAGATLTSATRPAGAGDGGASAQQGGTWPLNGALGGHGNNGAGRIKFTPSGLASDYSAVYHAVGYDQTFTAPNAGAAIIRAYGAGGASGTGNNARRGGAGGYVEFQVPMVGGDVLTMRVGGGGKRTRAGAGGVGGWPDGGQAGLFNNGNEAGGGGGSTQILLNGTLVGVAPGGGGSSGWQAGGGAGGLTGSTGTGNGTGTGGTQSAGGNSPFPTANTAGALLQGGKGYNTSATVLDGGAGGGGGGGYYGGGGGYSNNGDAPGGGGGSNYLNTGIVANQVSYGAGANDGLASSTPSIYRPGVGFGGYGGGAPAQNRADSYDGYDGLVALFFDNTMLVTGPLPPPITLTATVQATAGVPGQGTGAIANGAQAIQMINNLTGTGIVEVTIVLPVADDSIFVEPVLGLGGIAQAVTLALPGPIVMTPATAKAPVSVFVDGLLDTVLVVAPLGSGEAGPQVDIDPFDPLVLAVLNGTATGGGLGAASILPAWVTLSRPGGRGEAGPDIHPGGLPAVLVVAPDGNAQQLIFTLPTVALIPPTAIGEITEYGVQQPFEHDILVSAADGVGHGSVALEPPAVNPIWFPGEYGRVQVSPPIGGSQGSVGAAGAVGDFVLMLPPEGLKELVVDGLGLIGTLTMAPPEGFREDVIFAEHLPFPPITLSAPHGFKETVITGTAAFTAPVTLVPLEGVGGVSAETTADLTGVVTLTNELTTQVGLGYTVTDPDLLPFIQMIPMNAVTKFTVRIFVSLLPAKVIVSPVRGIATDGVVGFGGFDDCVIQVSPPLTTTAISGRIDNVIYLTPIDAYTDERPQPGFSLIKLKRSATEGVAPPILLDREIALNEADGVLYSLDGAGFVRPTPYLGFGEGRFVPGGGTNGQVLGIDGVWREPDPVAIEAVLPDPPAGTNVLLANAGEGNSISKPAGGVAAGKAIALYKPFFLPHRTRLVGLGVQQWGANLDGSNVVQPYALHLGLCSWEVDTGLPIATLAYGVTTASGAVGLQTVPIDVTLETGWYASILGLSNGVTASFLGVPGGYFLGDDFNPRGNPLAVRNVAGFTLDPPPQPETFIIASVANALADNPDLAYVQGITP